MALAVWWGLMLSSRRIQRESSAPAPVQPGEIAARARLDSPSADKSKGPRLALPAAPSPGLPGGGRHIGSGGVFVRGDYEKALVARGTPATDGEAAEVFVQISSSGRKLHLSPNQGREYPRVYVREGETVQVRVEFPLSEPGSPVAISPQDGGSLGGHPAKVIVLDAERALAFDFTASLNPGTHRVKLVTQRGEAHLLDFWAGPENQFRSSTAAR